MHMYHCATVCASRASSSSSLHVPSRPSGAPGGLPCEHPPCCMALCVHPGCDDCWSIQAFWCAKALSFYTYPFFSSTCSGELVHVHVFRAASAVKDVALCAAAVHIPNGLVQCSPPFLKVGLTIMNLALNRACNFYAGNTSSIALNRS